MLFSKVHYKLDEGKEANSYHLKLDLQDNTESFINFGARYNNQDAVSLLFNGTFNNLLFKNSRLSLDLKISEVPALNIRYNINQGSLPGLGLQYGYRRRVMLNYDEGQRVGEGSVAKRYFDVISNSVVEDYFTIGIGIRYENYKIDDILGTFALDEGRYNYLLYRSFLEIDTKDKAYYPTRGIKCYLHTDAITDNSFELNNKMPSITSFLSINNTCSFNNFWALTTSVSAQLQYVNSNPPPPLYDTYVGGSFQANDILSLIPFWGLRWGEYRANNIVALGAENRFKVADKHYLYLNANVLANSETLDNISASSLDYKLGFAVGYSYDSFVGPIELFLSLSDDMSLGNYINIGYYF